MSRFEWDEEKAKRNLRKHGVAFEILDQFEFDTAIEWIDDSYDYGEERIIAVGILGSKLCTLVYTFRGTTIRIISLRKASKKEVDKYVKSNF
ncbi:BrnT family toxin [Phyllobacterium sp. SB3]|uniref:BrnT family toxin n=1 Tax=Phyllobacterium sp. SB3 TaxID=3156073 RepID=UPI0032AEE2B3